MDESTSLFDMQTHASGPTGRLPLKTRFLDGRSRRTCLRLDSRRYDRMAPSDLGRDEYLILSTQGSLRASDGCPIVPGYHARHDGDTIQIIIDRIKLSGTLDFIGGGGREFDSAEGARILEARLPHPDLRPNPIVPDDTRLWATLQDLDCGTWGGCVYDVESIIEKLGDI